MITRFRTLSGSMYSFDDETMMFDRYLRGTGAVALRADTGKCTRMPEIRMGLPVAFHCEPLDPHKSFRLVVSTPVQEILGELEKAA